MKNTKLLLTMSIMASFLIGGCNANTDHNSNPDNLSILCPTGAPSIAFYNFADDNNFNTNDNAATGIKPVVVNGSVDVAILPTNLCVQLINSAHINYKLAATITFGNFYIVATGNDENNVMDEGDYIVSFQQGGVPDKVFHYIYGSTFDSSLRYVNSSNDVANVLANDTDVSVTDALGEKVDYVLISEPDYTIAKTYNSKISIYKNIQSEYKIKSNGLDMFQASILINKNVEKVKADRFLNNINKDISDGLANPSLIEQGMNKDDNAEMHFRVKPSIAKQLTQDDNKLGLGFKLAKDNKTSIDTFLSLFGIGATNEEIYY